MNARLEGASDAELLAMPDSEVADAFAVFYRRHRWPILNYLASRTRGDTHLALDLLAEVFARAYEKRHSYRPAHAPARAWLFGIAKNALTDAYRERAYEDSARRRLGMPERRYTDAAIAEVEERLDASEHGYLAGLEALPQDERDAIRARVLDDRAYPDIAAEAEVTQAVIRKRVSRGLARLRRWDPRG